MKPVPAHLRKMILDLFPEFQELPVEVFENSDICFEIVAQLRHESQRIDGMFFIGSDVTWVYYTLPHRHHPNDSTNFPYTPFGDFLRHQIVDNIKRAFILYNSFKMDFWRNVRNLYSGLLGGHTENHFRAIPVLPVLDTFPALELMADFISDHHRLISEKRHRLECDRITKGTETIKPISISLYWDNYPSYLKIFRRENFPHDTQDTMLICFPTPHPDTWTALRQTSPLVYQNNAFNSWLTSDSLQHWTIHTGLKSFYTFPDPITTINGFNNDFLNLHPLTNPVTQPSYLLGVSEHKEDLESFLNPDNHDDRAHWLIFADYLEEKGLEKQLCQLIRFFLGECSIAF